MRTIPYSTAMEILGWIYSKNGLPYHYGGSGNPGGDCSWFTMAVAAALQGKPRTQRYGSTETFRLASGQVLGLTRAASKAAVPRDAILKVGLMHGGGGYNSHTSGTFCGVNFESRGMYKGVSGHVVAGTARAWDDPLYHSWWYLDAKLGPRAVTEFPLPPQGWYYGPRSGPDTSVSGEAGEPGYQIDGLKQLARALGAPETGRWADVAERVKQIQRDADGALGPATGHVGPKTWARIVSPPPAPTPTNPPAPPATPPQEAPMDLNTRRRSFVEGSEFEDSLGNYILHADRNTYEALQEVRAMRAEMAQMTDLVSSLQARAASGDDRQQPATQS